MSLLALMGLPVLLVGWWVATYNRLVRLRNRMQDAWSGVEVVLTQRHDLIPNLVAAVRAYAAYESALIQAVVQARAGALGAGAGTGERLQAESTLGRSLRTLVAVAEAYPNLKVSAAFQHLMTQLVAVEETLRRARRYYNGTVREYNSAGQTFPSNLVAGWMGFAPAEFFEAEADHRATPAVTL